MHWEWCKLSESNKMCSEHPKIEIKEIKFSLVININYLDEDLKYIFTRSPRIFTLRPKYEDRSKGSKTDSIYYN